MVEPNLSGDLDTPMPLQFAYALSSAEGNSPASNPAESPVGVGCLDSVVQIVSRSSIENTDRFCPSPPGQGDGGGHGPRLYIASVTSAARASKDRSGERVAE